jgi:hypothetical protein
MTVTKIVLTVLLVIVLIALGPLLTIWSLNTLFPALVIPYSLETWAAVIVLGGVFKTNVSNSK